MEAQEVNKLAQAGNYPDHDKIERLVETTISWVFIGNKWVYKLKKPVKYSFVDFSSLSLREFYCKEEIRLNNRLTEGIYLDVLPVTRDKEEVNIGVDRGEVIDFVVRMNKLDYNQQLDVLLKKGSINIEVIQKLAVMISEFHRKAEIVRDEAYFNRLKSEFNDIGSIADFLKKQLGNSSCDTIHYCIQLSNAFLEKNTALIQQRVEQGFIRDCHGDMHSGNIFLYPEPVIFDCIEFSKTLRTIDVLKEVAFLCMDLEAFNRPDLSEVLLITYFNQKPAGEIRNLFIYYKCFQANVRAKVCALKAMNRLDKKPDDCDREDILKYLRLMKDYAGQIL